MNRQQGGFTLIEVVVVVVLGILGSMILPEFGNVGTQAGEASASSVASAMVVAAANNRVMCELGETATTVTTCTAATGLVNNVDWTDYVVGTGVGAPTGYITCTVTSTTGGATTSVVLRSTTAPC